MNKIKKGDQVHLKSGGPKMIVQSIGKYEKAKCGWFDGIKYAQAIFPIMSLIKTHKKRLDFRRNRV